MNRIYDTALLSAIHLQTFPISDIYLHIMIIIPIPSLPPQEIVLPTHVQCERKRFLWLLKAASEMGVEELKKNATQNWEKGCDFALVGFAWWNCVLSFIRYQLIITILRVLSPVSHNAQWLTHGIRISNPARMVKMICTTLTMMVCISNQLRKRGGNRFPVVYFTQT